jgi:hypothetical protein
LVELERQHTLNLSPDAEEDEDLETDNADPERKPGEGFAVLSSGGAELDEAIMSKTTLQLFPTDDPKPKKATAHAKPTMEAGSGSEGTRAGVGLRDQRATARRAQPPRRRRRPPNRQIPP